MDFFVIFTSYLGSLNTFVVWLIMLLFCFWVQLGFFVLYFSIFELCFCHQCRRMKTISNLLAVKLEVAAPAPDVGRGSETQDCARVSVCPVSCLSGLRAAIALTRSHAANVSSLLRRPWTTMTRRHCRRRVTRHVFLRSCISRTEFFEFKLCQ